MAIDDLMEDTATAEISRAQLWQWRRQAVELDDGRRFDATRYREIRDQELERLGGADGGGSDGGDGGDGGAGHLGQAAEILDRLVLDDDFVEFLTWVAGDQLKG